MPTPSTPPFGRDLFLHLKARSTPITHTQREKKKNHICTQMVYATFVTSHALVISRDTKPTRSPYPIFTHAAQMEPYAGIKPGTEKENRRKRYQEEERKKERGGGYMKPEVYFDLKRWFLFVFTTYTRGEGALSLAYTNAPPLRPDRDRHNESSVLLGHWNACQANHLGCIQSHTPC